MATTGNTLKVCNYNRTMTLDGAALGRALGREAIPIYTELCRKEVDGFTSALGSTSCTVACTQEAPLFTELAAGAGGFRVLLSASLDRGLKLTQLLGRQALMATPGSARPCSALAKVAAGSVDDCCAS